MGSLNKTESLKKLEDTIKHLNNTAHAEDIELKKEEDVVMKLKVTIKDYKCDCAYNSWGHWGTEGSPFTIRNHPVKTQTFDFLYIFACNTSQMQFSCNIRLSLAFNHDKQILSGFL